MSLYGLLTTSASGMNAQSTLLGSIADNIANINTIGYKDASQEFASMVLDASGVSSGSVLASARIAINAQGNITGTNNSSDLAIQGNGFFIVQDSSGLPLLTRAGSFQENAAGNLVNTAGYTLLGYPTGTTGAANGFNGLIPINLSTLGLKASPSTSGQLFLNLPSTDHAYSVGTDILPNANSASSQVEQKTSLVAYDNLGNQVTLDVYLTKVDPATLTPAGTEPSWEVDIFDASTASTSSSSKFPYGTQLTSNTAPPVLTFDPTTGALSAGSPITFTVPNGRTLTLDMSQSTQLATDYTILQASTNGNAPSQVANITISSDGTLSTVYKNGATVEQYTIPLATVVSPNSMTVMTGNAFEPNESSGAPQIGKAGLGGVGTIKSSALESSTVDLASQLAKMIEAQNNYQANSKVFQTGSQLLQVLFNLER